MSFVENVYLEICKRVLTVKAFLSFLTHTGVTVAATPCMKFVENNSHTSCASSAIVHE